MTQQTKSRLQIFTTDIELPELANSFASTGARSKSVTSGIKPVFNATGANSQSFDQTLNINVGDALVSDTLAVTIAEDLDTLSQSRQSRCIASCHALGDIGFSKLSLSEVRNLVIAAHRWSNSLRALMQDNATKPFFPDGITSIQAIHRLAVLHDKRIRPPRRYFSNAWGPLAKRRTLRIYREAREHCDDLESRLKKHRYWLDIDSMPLSAKSLAYIARLNDRQPKSDFTPTRRQAMRWLSRYLRKDADLDSQSLRDGIHILYRDLDNIDKFQNHVLYSRHLGPAFQGLNTHWNELHVFIGYSQSIHDVLGDPAVAGRVVDNWAQQAEHLYKLARKASTVSRRTRKLAKLLTRQYTVSDNPELFLLTADALLERMDLWLAILAQYNESLSPAQIIASHRNLARSESNHSH